MDKGIVPDNILSSQYNISNELRLPIDEGSCNENLFSCKYNPSRENKLPIDEGIGPVNELPANNST